MLDLRKILVLLVLPFSCFSCSTPNIDEYSDIPEIKYFNNVVEKYDLNKMQEDSWYKYDYIFYKKDAKVASFTNYAFQIFYLDKDVRHYGSVVGVSYGEYIEEGFFEFEDKEYNQFKEQCWILGDKTYIKLSFSNDGINYENETYYTTIGMIGSMNGLLNNYNPLLLFHERSYAAEQITDVLKYGAKFNISEKDDDLHMEIESPMKKIIIDYTDVSSFLEKSLINGTLTITYKDNDLPYDSFNYSIESKNEEEVPAINFPLFDEKTSSAATKLNGRYDKLNYIWYPNDLVSFSYTSLFGKPQ